jgi:hypothetical protein
VGARFSAPVPTEPGSHPAFDTMGTASFPGVKRPKRGVDHPFPSSAEVEEMFRHYRIILRELVINICDNLGNNCAFVGLSTKQ